MLLKVRTTTHFPRVADLLCCCSGNNYFASRVGFGCDNVVNYEVVLANGSIIDVNNQTYVDLFKALKGGTSNFGIVTRFDMQPIPAQDLWGGSIVSTKDTSDAVIDATIKYAQLPEADALDDSAIVIYVHNTTLSDEEYIIISALTNTQGVSNSTAFTDFRQLNSVSTSYAMYNMVDYLVAGENAGGERYVILVGLFILQMGVPLTLSIE